MHSRYILMRHDEAGHNLAYLYAHSMVVLCTRYRHAIVDVVQVQSEGEEAEAQWLANYQLSRLASGMEQRSLNVYRTVEEARDEAERVAQLLGTLKS